MQTEKQRDKPLESEKRMMHKREPYLDFNESLRPSAAEDDVTPVQPLYAEAESANGSAKESRSDQETPDPIVEPQSELEPEPQVEPESEERGLKEKLASAEEKAAEMQQAYLRTKADLENFRRRAQEDLAKANKFAIEGFAESLVPVKDSLEAALKIDAPTLESIKEGVEMTLKQLNNAFDKNRLTEICPMPGDKLDPMKHQAISMVPGGQNQNPNTIISVLQKGYMTADRLLRPALVTVAQGK
jgi:molecular chaperone GrpE